MNDSLNSKKLRVFVSSVQKELEDERLIVQNLMNTDVFRTHSAGPRFAQ
jgi:hypothetical protein